MATKAEYLLSILSSIPTIIKNTTGRLINNGFKISIVSGSSELERNLRRLDVDINTLSCVYCKTPIVDLNQVRGVYKYKGEVFSYCNELECELRASHQLLEK